MYIHTHTYVGDDIAASAYIVACVIQSEQSCFALRRCSPRTGNGGGFRPFTKYLFGLWEGKSEVSSIYDLYNRVDSVIGDKVHTVRV